MAPNQEDKAAAALKAMKVASETVRGAIASAIPVASNQILTVSVPGTVINVKDYYYNADETIKAPLAVRVAEARLVDGMIPLSKFTAGKTGKSVARSYLSTLDLMVPVEASVSGLIGGSDPKAVVEERLVVIRDRYNRAMDYLKSADDSPNADGRSKLGTYVLKQESWSKAVEAYTSAQDRALASVKPPPGATRDQVKEARELYLQWIQEHGRDYKHTIQAKYMDWVVHGYKFMIDFNFAIVDISSGMKRIENSKEAFRNLTLIADDGVSEYHSVILTPSDWATIIKEKTEKWDRNNSRPTPAEIRAEIRRLKNLLASHETLLLGIEEKALFPVITNEEPGDEDRKLRNAYADVYANIESENAKQVPKVSGATPADAGPKWRGKVPLGIKKVREANSANTQIPPAQPETPPDNPFENLRKAQQEWGETSLSRNKATVRTSIDTETKAASGWLEKKIKQLEEEIKQLEVQLGDGAEGKLLPLKVVNEQGITITEAERSADPQLLGKPVPAEASKWTRVSCKVSSSEVSKASETSESSSSVAARGGWGWWKASGGASHTSSSASAMESMSNLDVEISMDCLVVDIDRPWLHAELFTDAELDSGGFDISPGEADLKRMYESGQVPDGKFQQFTSFPTAFVVAADIELSFSGNTTSLESAVSASSTQANLSVGYGPFKVSGSHKSSKSSSKTKMESTATGCKISVQAPQIVGWVQTLIPQLPKRKDGKSLMAGLS